MYRLPPSLWVQFVYSLLVACCFVVCNVARWQLFRSITRPSLRRHIPLAMASPYPGCSYGPVSSSNAMLIVEQRVMDLEARLAALEASTTSRLENVAWRQAEFEKWAENRFSFMSRWMDWLSLLFNWLQAYPRWEPAMQKAASGWDHNDPENPGQAMDAAFDF